MDQRAFSKVRAEPPRSFAKSSTAKLPPAIDLEVQFLQSQRIFAHDGTDPRARPYDLLRAHLLKVMTDNDWRIVGVTSPTPKCGKTLTAINLAFSIARQPEDGVLLVDLNLSEPSIAKNLGIDPPNGGVLDLLGRRAALENSVVSVSAAPAKPMLVLTTEGCADPSSYVSSDAVDELLQRLLNRYSDRIIILDLPSMLTSDEVITILPDIDCFLLVTAIGSSNRSEVEECVSRFDEGRLVRVVVNRTPDANHFYS